MTTTGDQGRDGRRTPPDRDLEEVRLVGSRGSTERDEDQSDTAWLAPQYQYGPALAALVAETGRPQQRKVQMLPFTARWARDDGKVVVRTYDRGTAWSTLTQENVDARVLAGVHFRFSDEVGVVLGRRVATAGMRRLRDLVHGGWS